MEQTIHELVDLLVRWTHIIAGIMWIGNSMLFNWLDRNLVPLEQPKDGVEGKIWLVHSGAFYEVEKKLLPPGMLPSPLHWFKWQNFTTWASGIALLIVVYYMGGAAYMINPAVADISLRGAIAIGVGTLVGSWLIYDGVWRFLGKQPSLAFLLSFGLLIGVVYGLNQLLSGRAAYIHVGVMLGTLMTGNVWFHIIPSQAQLIASTKAGLPQDKELSLRAKQRSIHNNYMTFPVLFIMLSNHFPSTYDSRYGWLILLALMVSSAAVRHFMNIRFWYRPWLRAAASAGVAGVAVAFVLITAARPAPLSAVAAQTQGPRVPFTAVRQVITQRCISCHSTAPSDDQFGAAPAGITFDDPLRIQALATRIQARVVDAQNMPFGNKTSMTDEERQLLAQWIAQGASLK